MGTSQQRPVITAHVILFVDDQSRSRDFYRRVLNVKPRLDVPGMTEFELNDGAILGLMPCAGIKKLLHGRLPAIAPQSFSRSEVYLLVADPEDNHRRALEAGAVELDGMKVRDWGHVAAYSLDLDNHVLAFARKATTADLC